MFSEEWRTSNNEIRDETSNARKKEKKERKVNSYTFFLHPGLVYWDLTLAIFAVQARYNGTLSEKAEEVSW